MKKSTLSHMAMYQNVLAVVNDHESAWNGIQGMVTAVSQFRELLNSLAPKLNLQSTLTQGVRVEKNAYLRDLVNDMSLLKKGLFLYAVENSNLVLRERHKESKSKLNALPADRIQVLCISLLEDLETYGGSLVNMGISAQQIQEFRNKVVLLEDRKNSVRQAIIERSLETRNIKEIEKQLNRLLIDRMDRLISFFKTADHAFFASYQSARRIIGNGGGNTGPRNREQDDGAVS